jgi:hypothetical protein
MFQGESIVARALPASTNPYRTDQAVESRDEIAFWPLVLLLVLLPIERMLIPFNLKPADLMLVLLMGYGLLKAWQARQQLVFPLLLPIWLILVSSLIATLVGFVRFENLIATVQEIYLFTWFIALVNLLRTLALTDLDRLMKIWSLVACLEATTTFMGMLRIGPSMFYTKPSYDEMQATTDLVRGVGTFVNSNAAAVYLSVSFFVLLATSWPLWLRSGLGIWIFAGLFGTGSNGALLSTLIGLMVAVMVHSIINNRRNILLWGSLIGMGLGTVAVVLLLFGVSSSLLSRFRFDISNDLLFQTVGRFSHSLKSRLTIAQWAWRIYSQNPWGIGPNSFSTLAGSLHNDYAAFLFERGPLGLIGWVWMIGATLVMSLRTAIKLIDRFQSWQVLALGAGFLACAINAFTHEISHMRQVWLLMVFLFALGYALLSEYGQSDRMHSKRELNQA